MTDISETSESRIINAIKAIRSNSKRADSQMTLGGISKVIDKILKENVAMNTPKAKGNSRFYCRYIYFWKH